MVLNYCKDLVEVSKGLKSKLLDFEYYIKRGIREKENFCVSYNKSYLAENLYCVYIVDKSKWVVKHDRLIKLVSNPLDDVFYFLFLLANKFLGEERIDLSLFKVSDVSGSVISSILSRLSESKEIQSKSLVESLGKGKLS